MTRTYIVWRSVTPREEAPMIELVGYIEANGAHQAISKARASEAIEPEDGDRESYHAIPERNWTTIDAIAEIPEPRTLFVDGELPMFDVKRPVAVPDPIELPEELAG